MPGSWGCQRVKSSQRNPISPAYLDLKAVAAYTSICVRTWRAILKRPDAPPYYRVQGKILIGREAVDDWLERFRENSNSLDLVNEVVNDLTRNGKARAPGRKGRG